VGIVVHWVHRPRELEGLGAGGIADDLRRNHVAADHLLALVNDVLELAKVEAGQMDMFVEAFELTTLLEQAGALVAPMMAKNGNRLVMTET
jgi:signal transduction histidine kinase